MKSENFYSPTDLILFAQSPFISWMSRYAYEFPDISSEMDANDELMGVLQKKGFQREIAQKKSFQSQGLSVVSIEGESKTVKKINTLNAMKNGVDVIYQAYLEHENFCGYADFLVKTAGQSDFGDYYYEIWDTKLSTKTKPEFIIQLCCYSEMLESLQGRKPDIIVVVLGNGNVERHPVEDFYYYYLSLKNNFLLFHDQFNPDLMPDPADSKSWGNWSTYAEKRLSDKDHLFQIANITRGQIKKLNHSGINTIQDLIETELSYVSGINTDTFNRLKKQAHIQKESIGLEKPKYSIFTHESGIKKGLALLPTASPYDIFFDIEGFPLEEGGLEYLWGCAYFDDQGNRQYKDFWAHNNDQEKMVFENFIIWAYQRWQADPSMHIYHYASYEVTACRKLMGRYGICEFEVDQLLRNEVFVDLFSIVKHSLLLGEPRYSIKNVEHLYRGKRETAVGSGGDSVVVYEKWRELHAIGEEGDTYQTSSILNGIREYNIDDCHSTQELVDWLRDRQKENKIEYLGKTEIVEPEVKEETTQKITLRNQLLQKLDQVSSNEKSLNENIAWMLEFHRREQKPLFWRLFDRLSSSEQELFDDLDCLALCKRTAREPFKPNSRARNLAYEYQFEVNQEFKGAFSSFYILGHDDENGKNCKVTLCESESDFENGLIVVQSKNEPPSIITLIPDEYISPDPIPKAIYKTACEYHEGILNKSAILDFLLRSKPRIKNHSVGSIAQSHDPDEKLKQIITAIKNLDHSYLTIQGPPGAGKSYTAKHVIAELARTGAKIGISSNSHKAINHLLSCTADYCNQEKISSVFVCTKETDPNLLKKGIVITGNSQLSQHSQNTCVLGTTAWGFAREDMENKLDYLFIDEAGQVSVANLIAMSRCAKNLVIMGDQMQLGQPLQGSHPAESGLSILDYLLHETPTISDDMGVFLGTTYRMHSKINQFISKFIYEGKLKSHSDNDLRVIKVPDGYFEELNEEAGIIFVPVIHEGNTYGSDEEVEKIKSLVYQLIGRTFVEKENLERQITLDDILFVAPYNYQVKKLKQALGEQAKVGSVDKFQGQEAPIVILSMCSSDPTESPRGIDFLFDKHRLNVAISRAQSIAIVVANPNIIKTAANNTRQMGKINLFAALCNKCD